MSRPLLAPRERQVIAKVVEGKTNREIARDFGTSYFTVKNQLTLIFAKTGCRNRAALAAWAASRNEKEDAR